LAVNNTCNISMTQNVATIPQQHNQQSIQNAAILTSRPQLLQEESFTFRRSRRRCIEKQNNDRKNSNQDKKNSLGNVPSWDDNIDNSLSSISSASYNLDSSHKQRHQQNKEIFLLPLKQQLQKQEPPNSTSNRTSSNNNNVSMVHAPFGYKNDDDDDDDESDDETTTNLMFLPKALAPANNYSGATASVVNLDESFTSAATSQNVKSINGSSSGEEGEQEQSESEYTEDVSSFAQDTVVRNSCKTPDAIMYADQQHSIEVREVEPQYVMSFAVRPLRNRSNNSNNSDDNIKQQQQQSQQQLGQPPPPSLFSDQIFMGEDSIRREVRNKTIQERVGLRGKAKTTPTQQQQQPVVTLRVADEKQQATAAAPPPPPPTKRTENRRGRMMNKREGFRGGLVRQLSASRLECEYERLQNSGAKFHHSENFYYISENLNCSTEFFTTQSPPATSAADFRMVGHNENDENNESHVVTDEKKKRNVRRKFKSPKRNRLRRNHSSEDFPMRTGNNKNKNSIYRAKSFDESIARLNNDKNGGGGCGRDVRTFLTKQKSFMGGTKIRRFGTADGNTNNGCYNNNRMFNSSLNLSGIFHYNATTDAMDDSNDNDNNFNKNHHRSVNSIMKERDFGN